MSKNILVTGGAGFIGSHLCDYLLANGHKVVALDNLVNGSEANLAEATQHELFTFIKGDILSQDDCLQATKNIDVVFHLACLGVRHSLHDPFMNHRVNAEGTLNVLEAAKKNGVKKLFYISTSEIYGDITTFPITEEGLPKPKTVYGASKLAGEHYAYSYYTCFGMDTTVVRIFNNYGPRAHYEGDSGEIIPRSIVMALYGKSPIIFGDGLITRDFFFVKDTARALGSLMNNETLKGQLLNIGRGIEITMKELLEKVLSLMALPEKIEIEYMPDRPADVVRLWVDSTKFQQVSGFNSFTDFDNGLLETIAYYRELLAQKDLLKNINIINWK